MVFDRLEGQCIWEGYWVGYLKREKAEHMGNQTHEKLHFGQCICDLMGSNICSLCDEVHIL